MTDSSSCLHDGPRERGAVPLVCGLCGGVEIARAPHSRCARCKGDGRRDLGWEKDGPLWCAVDTPHLSTLAHQFAVAPPYLETPTNAAPPATAPAHTERGRGDTTRSGTLSPEGAAGFSSGSSVPVLEYKAVPDRAESPPCVRTAAPSLPSSPDLTSERGGSGGPTNRRSRTVGAVRPTRASSLVRPPDSSSSTRPDEPAVSGSSASSSRISGVLPPAKSNTAPAPPAWSGAGRLPCPRCGSSTRRDNLSRHLKRCARGETTTP